jgi:hypothetical protein
MESFKVIINTETAEVCSVESFINKVNTGLNRNAYTVGKVYGEPDEEECGSDGSESEQEQVRELVTEQYLEGLVQRVIALELAEKVQDRVNTTVRAQLETYENTIRFLNQNVLDLKRYTLGELDNVVKGLKRNRGGADPKPTRGRGRPKKTDNSVPSNTGVRRGRGRPRKTDKVPPEIQELDKSINRVIAGAESTSKRRGRGRPRKTAA